WKVFQTSLLLVEYGVVLAMSKVKETGIREGDGTGHPGLTEAVHRVRPGCDRSMTRHRAAPIRRPSHWVGSGGQSGPRIRPSSAARPVSLRKCPPPGPRPSRVR